MTLPVDLHTHSNASDGRHDPAALVALADAAGVALMALTDHDTTDGLAAASAAAASLPVTLVTGVEISVTWQGGLVHVVGLRVDPQEQALRAGLQRLQAQRIDRAEEMGRRLGRCGAPGMAEAAGGLAGSGQVGRVHFARALVAAGHARDLKRAFQRYLKPGGSGYVPAEWAGLEEAVAWIRGAGGTAVLAHPARYHMTRTKLQRLLAAFRTCGGEAIEVVSGVQTPRESATLWALAEPFGLLASAGSDYHGLDGAWGGLGRLAPLPSGCRPLWAEWPEWQVLEERAKGQ